MTDLAAAADLKHFDRVFANTNRMTSNQIKRLNAERVDQMPMPAEVAAARIY
jgi:hypothetical protein